MDLGDILNEMSQTADKGRCCVILPVRDQNGQTHRLKGNGSCWAWGREPAGRTVQLGHMSKP